MTAHGVAECYARGVLTLEDPGYEFWHRFSDGREGAPNHPIIPRWRRVRELRSSKGAASALAPLESAPLAERQRYTRCLFDQGCDLLRASAEAIHRRGCALVFADPEGTVVAARGLDVFTDPAVRDTFREGDRWTEAVRGTNAIGTALAEDAAVTVIGRAHCDPLGHGLVCYAAPIHDLKGRVIGVLDVTGPVDAADPLLGVTVESLASSFEGMLRARALDELATRIEMLETERAEVRHDRDDLAEALRWHETFLATVGHDLRNPLTAVLNGAELLSRLNVPHPRAVDLIHSSGRRMVGLLDQLADVARGRLAGGIHVADDEMVDLTVLAERVVDETRLASPRALIRLARSGTTLGYWDAGRLEQVLSNLVGNAVRHGDVTQPIDVLVDGDDPDVVSLVVTNAGEIESSLMPFLFDPFRSRTARRSRKDGLGLGLYIVSQVVSAHHGDIDVESRLGRTTFRVSLPRRARVALYPA